MKNKQMMAALLAGGLTLATGLKAAEPPNQAPPAPESTPPSQPQPGQSGQMQFNPNTQGPRKAASAHEQSYLSAAYILGREVRNDMGERLGTVHDLIINLDSDSARFAIIKSGGTLGIGGTRVAVPLKDLQWTGDTKEFIMAATKEQILSASAVPTGAWAFAVNQDWAAKVDRFYGDPGKFDLSLSARPAMTESRDSREFVRDAAQPVPAVLPEDELPNPDMEPKTPPSTPSDGELLVQVDQIIGQYAGPATGSDVRPTVEKGVVTLKGKVATATQKSILESRIRGLNEVVRLIDDQLLATNE